MSSQESEWTRRVAEFIVDGDPKSASHEVRDLAAHAAIDTLACFVAGLDSEAGRVMLAYGGFEPDAALVDVVTGGSGTVDAQTRALILGTLGAAIDYDDVSMNGHPSSIVLASVLTAAAGRRPLDGASMLDAYLIGYEVSARVGDMFDPVAWLAKDEPSDRDSSVERKQPPRIDRPGKRHGWHTTSVAGYFGATASACRLWGLDVDQTMHAIGVAASMAAGLQRNFGTVTKPLHSGLAARGGLTAAELARWGVTSARDVLEGPGGFVAVYGLGLGDPARAARLASPWAMTDRPPSLKKFPACYVAHRVIDAVLNIQHGHDFRESDVIKIVLRAPTSTPRSTSFSRYHRPETGLQGKFSIEYAAAAAFLDRAVTIASFDDAAVRRPEIRRVMDMIELVENPPVSVKEQQAASVGSGGSADWEVTVHTAAGSVARESSLFPPGAPERPLTEGDIEAKFLDCARSVGHDQVAAQAAFEQLRSLEAVGDIAAALGGLGQRRQHAVKDESIGSDPRPAAYGS